MEPLAGQLRITAAALTEFLARWLDDSIEHPESPPPEVTREGMKELFTNVLKRKKPPAGEP